MIALKLSLKPPTSLPSALVHQSDLSLKDSDNITLPNFPDSHGIYVPALPPWFCPGTVTSLFLKYMTLTSACKLCGIIAPLPSCRCLFSSFLSRKSNLRDNSLHGILVPPSPNLLVTVSAPLLIVDLARRMEFHMSLFSSLIVVQNLSLGAYNCFLNK